VSDLAAKLAALRKQAGGQGATVAHGGAGARAAGGVPAVAGTRAIAGAVPPAIAPGVDLAALRRMAGVRDRLGIVKAVTPRAMTRDVPGEEIAPGLRYLEYATVWPEPPEEFDLSFARLTTARREHLLHFDTETTGLAGGTGTRAFMIGAADWHGGRLRVRQLYMTSMAAETAMLNVFASWVGAETVLVSYNGKSYDAPLLSTRYRLARLPNPLMGLTHVDLLHPMRRRFRHAWENCKMQTAERKLLRIVREDDLPGSEAPRAWLTYLRGGSSTDLIRVAEHNLQDVRSLSGLLVEAHGWAALDAQAASPASNEK
jgi:uncharacterized protein YprB with RNaseH-like and TPR domain